YGGILKQVKGGKEQIVQFTFRHWNPTQQNYKSFFKNAPKLRDKGKGKIEESSKTQITSKPIRSWYEICHEEDEKSTSLSKSSKNTIIQDAHDPNEIGSQIKKWIESLSQSLEVALAFLQVREETPLKQIAAEAAKVSKNKEIVLHKPKSLKNVLKETSIQDVFP
ncbi:hypothetical protein Gotur_025587, partial [Gossypium turneri]